MSSSVSGSTTGFAQPPYIKTRPVWTGFKIAVRHKLLTHYKKAKVLYDLSKKKKGLMLNWYESKLIFQ